MYFEFLLHFRILTEIVLFCYTYAHACVQADEALALGELQLKEGFRFDAHLNFHTACVYYRVMECLIPSLKMQVHPVRTHQVIHFCKKYLFLFFNCSFFNEFFHTIGVGSVLIFFLFLFSFFTFHFLYFIFYSLFFIFYILFIIYYFLFIISFLFYYLFIFFNLQRLQYAAARSRQCSSLSHNFIREHFEGESCSAIYEVHGSNKLGEGSYGSVYLATHKLTGDERAVKVMNVDRVTSYYLRKLHTEISILKCVDHPNIVKVRDKYFYPIFPS